MGKQMTLAEKLVLKTAEATIIACKRAVFVPRWLAPLKKAVELLQDLRKTEQQEIDEKQGNLFDYMEGSSPPEM